MKRINTHLSGQEVERLEKLSVSMGIPKAEIIRRAVDEYLDIRGVVGGVMAFTGVVGLKESSK